MPTDEPWLTNWLLLLWSSWLIQSFTSRLQWPSGQQLQLLSIFFVSWVWLDCLNKNRVLHLIICFAAVAAVAWIQGFETWLMMDSAGWWAQFMYKRTHSHQTAWLHLFDLRERSPEQLSPKADVVKFWFEMKRCTAQIHVGSCPESRGDAGASFSKFRVKADHTLDSNPVPVKTRIHGVVKAEVLAHMDQTPVGRVHFYLFFFLCWSVWRFQAVWPRKCENKPKQSLKIVCVASQALWAYREVGDRWDEICKSEWNILSIAHLCSFKTIQIPPNTSHSQNLPTFSYEREGTHGSRVSDAQSVTSRSLSRGGFKNWAEGAEAVRSEQMFESVCKLHLKAFTLKT